MSTIHIGGNGETEPAKMAPLPALTSSASFKSRSKKPNTAGAGAGAGGVISRGGSEVDDVRVELNRLENEVRGSHSLSLPLSLCFFGSQISQFVSGNFLNAH